MDANTPWWDQELTTDHDKLEEIKNRLANAARSILAEGTQLRLAEFQQEMYDRAGKVEGDGGAVRRVFNVLEGRGELDYQFGRPILVGPNLIEPDLTAFPKFEEHLIPVEAAQGNDIKLNEFESAENTRRAIATQKTLQNYLDGGDTIWVKHPDGTMEEILFTNSQVAV